MDAAHSRFLVIDDHALLRRMVSAELRKIGAVEIDEASDGNVAMQKIQAALQESKPYHIAFLDWTMPAMNGFDVLLTCRAERALDSMSIIMLSSESEETNIIRAMEAGATAYITKPFKQGDIERKVADVLAWRSLTEGGF